MRYPTFVMQISWDMWSIVSQKKCPFSLCNLTPFKYHLGVRDLIFSKNITYSHHTPFSISLPHALMLFRSLCSTSFPFTFTSTCPSIFFSEKYLMKILLSCANKLTGEIISSGRSFMYIRKNGPKTDLFLVT